MRRALAVLTALGLVLALAGPAGAFTRADRWRCRSDGATVTRGWTKDFGDSPNDGANKQAFRVALDSGEYLYCYSPTGPYSPETADSDIPLADVENLSFEYRTADLVGAGELMEVAILTNGDYLYLDAFYCSEPIGTSGWSRADFTGDTDGGCTVYALSGGSYTSGGGKNVFEVYAETHPDAELDYVYMLFSAYTGIRVVDRVALGDRLYFGGGVRQIRDCTFGEQYC